MSRKLRIAMVLEGDLKLGGGFQQSLSVLTQLYCNTDFEFIPVVFSRQNQQILQTLNIQSIFCKRSIISKIKEQIIRLSFIRFYLHRFPMVSALEQTLHKNNIDICYFLTQSILSLSLVNMRYILTIFDTSHRDFLEFPEVYEYFEFDKREFMFHHAVNKAVAVIVDSAYGKENVISRYNTSPNRVHICHFSPSINANPNTNLHQTPIDIKKKYNIQGEYIYYPAQFWAHKNHIYILEALQLLKKQGIILHAIFSGSNKGNLGYILQSIKQMGLQNQAHYIGFAPNEEISSLYSQSLALVMPTYFGPTNIPPLEAFALGVPVVYSNLPDLKEQVVDAALLCDLTNPQSLASHLYAILQDENLRQSLIQNGYKRLQELNARSITDVITPILRDFAIKQKSWKSPTP